MQASEFIDHQVPVLKKTDVVGTALSWMEELRVDALPVTDCRKFLGFVDQEVLEELPNSLETLDQVPLENSSCWVIEGKHLYDLLGVAYTHHSKWVAVVDRNMQYLGVVPIEKAIETIVKDLSAHVEGSVLSLSMQIKEYQLSEIARLVESENAKILSCLVSSNPIDSTAIEVIIKLDKVDVRHIKATLERFGYRVREYFREDAAISTEEERIGNLLRFLDI
ncbi:MAG: cbs domain containing protein [Bacteroidota bacterium]|jgi:predicted transcriptional regulator with HTH domain